MSQPAGAWNLRNVSPEARAAAKQAAADAGILLGAWLAALIRKVDAEEALARKPVRIVSDSGSRKSRLSSIERAMLRRDDPTGGANKDIAAA